MKDYKKPIMKAEIIVLEDVILESGVTNSGTLDSFNPDETWTIFDGGKE